MTDFKSILVKLNSNLNILHEREAKYAGNAPIELLNQIADHQTALSLTKQASTGELTEVKWREAIRPLLVDIRTQSEAHPDWGVTIGDIEGSIIAGGDINVSGDIVINIGGKKVAIPRYLQWAIAGIAAGVLFLVIYQLYKVWAEQPPAQMGKVGFNIAVAEFTVAEQSTEDIGANLAGEVARYLQEEEQTIHKEISRSITIWGDQPTVAKVEPQTEEEAAKRAKDLNADILVYGILTETELEPKFYIKAQSFGIADELRGTFKLGAPLYYSPGAIGEINESLKTRIKDFAVFVLGIDKYGQGTFKGYQKAAEIFEQLALDEADDNLGNDVMYLFTGASYHRQAACYEGLNESLKCFQENNPDKRYILLIKAQEAYSNSIRVNPEYGRVYVSLGAVYFDLAKPTNPADQCNWQWNTLQSAQSKYQQALEATEKPGAVELRAHLGIGKILFFNGICHSDQASLQEAQTHYEIVLKEYATLEKPVDFTLDAMKAYTDLGMVALMHHYFAWELPDNQPPLVAASSYYSRTIKLADEFMMDTSKSPSLKELIANQKLAVQPFLIAAYCLNNQQKQAQAYFYQQSEEDRIKIQRDIVNNFGNDKLLKECTNEN